MKRLRIFCVISTIFILSLTFVYAAIVYSAKDISFKSNDESFTATNVEDAINTLVDESKKEVVYSVSVSVSNNAETSSGVVIVPTLGKECNSNRTYYTSSYLNDKYTVVDGSYITLPKGKYQFNSVVYYRTSAYGTGFKIFDTSGNLLLDHTYAVTTSTYYESEFDLEKDTNVVVKWYRSNTGWYDVASYTIERIG